MASTKECDISSLNIFSHKFLHRNVVNYTYKTGSNNQ